MQPPTRHPCMRVNDVDTETPAPSSTSSDHYSPRCPWIQHLTPALREMQHTHPRKTMVALVQNDATRLNTVPTAPCAETDAKCKRFSTTQPARTCDLPPSVDVIQTPAVYAPTPVTAARRKYSPYHLVPSQHLHHEAQSQAPMDVPSRDGDCETSLWPRPVTPAFAVTIAVWSAARITSSGTFLCTPAWVGGSPAPRRWHGSCVGLQVAETQDEALRSGRHPLQQFALWSQVISFARGSRELRCLLAGRSTPSFRSRLACRSRREPPGLLKFLSERTSSANDVGRRMEPGKAGEEARNEYSVRGEGDDRGQARNSCPGQVRREQGELPRATRGLTKVGSTGNGILDCT
jgi:hypothetical protein